MDSNTLLYLILWIIMIGLLIISHYSSKHFEKKSQEKMIQADVTDFVLTFFSPLPVFRRITIKKYLENGKVYYGLEGEGLKWRRIEPSNIRYVLNDQQPGFENCKWCIESFRNCQDCEHKDFLDPSIRLLSQSIENERYNS